ncbi:MAG: deoxyhypusine synthase [archaeon]
MIKEEKIARNAVLKKAENSFLSNLPVVKGPDFSKNLSLNELIDSYENIGFQASNLGKAVKIIQKMRKEKAVIFLAFSSNMVSSGLREIIAFLVKNKFVDVLVTTTGGIEEDLIKTIQPFYLGEFHASGKELRENAINRIGNVFVSNNGYIELEKILNKFWEKIYELQKKEDKIFTPSEIIFELGKKFNDEKSIYYWATKNNIPVFCPAITDGAIGDNIYFFKQKRKDFAIDSTSDLVKLNNLAIAAEKTGIILLGAGIVKHHVCNANLFRDGAEFAVYINTEPEYNGCDSGALPEEAVSWGKIKPEADRIKVFADATLVFPLIVARAFK